MSEPPGQKRKQLGPSGLRNEVHPGSTDRERVNEQSDIQVAHSDEVIPETQLEEYTYSTGHDDDGTSLSPNTKAMMEKCRASKPKGTIDTDPLQVKYLSKEGFGEDSLTLPPSFTFQQARPMPPKKDSRVEPTGSASVTGGIQAFIGNAAQDGTELRRDEIGPTLGLVKVARNGERSYSGSSNPARPVQVSAMRQQEEPKPESRDQGIGPSYDATELGHGQDSVDPNGTTSPQTGQAPTRSSRQTRRPGKDDKKGRRGRNVQRPATLCPPQSSQTAPHDELTAQPLLLDQSEAPFALDVSLPTPNLPAARSPGEPIEPPIEDPPDPVISAEEADPRVHHAPEPETPKINSPPPPPALPRTPNASRREMSDRVRPGRVNKLQKKARAPASTYSAAPRPVQSGAGLSYAEMFEQHIQSVRVSYYAESVRNEHHYGSEIKIREEKIAELQIKSREDNDRLKALEEREVDRLVAVKQQQEKVKNLQKYVKGIANDHEKLKTMTTAHQKESMNTLQSIITEMQTEKASLERDFRNTVEALENSRRSTVLVLDDCYARLEISEKRRMALVQELKTQTLVLEEERESRQNEAQLRCDTLDAIRLQIEAINEALEERLCRIPVEQTGAHAKRDEDIQYCIHALDELKDTPVVTINDIDKIEGMLQKFHEGVNSKVSDLSKSVEANRFPAKEVQDYIHEQLQTLKSDILKYEEANAELQKSRNANEQLAKQLELEKITCEGLEGCIKELRQSELDLKASSTQLEQELEKARNDASHSSEETEKEVAGLRDQLRQAETNLQAARSKLEAVEQYRQNDIAELKKSAQELEEQLNQVKEQMEKECKNADNTRDKLTEQHRKEIEEKTASWNAQFRSLENERDKKEKLLQEMGQDLQKTRKELQIAGQELQAHKDVTMKKMKEKFDEEALAYRKLVDKKMAEDVAQMRQQIQDEFRTREQEIVNASSQAQSSQQTSSSQGPSSLPRILSSSAPVQTKWKPKRKISRQKSPLLGLDVPTRPQSVTISGESFLPGLSDPIASQCFNDLGERERLDENGVSVIHPGVQGISRTARLESQGNPESQDAREIPETQEIPELVETQDVQERNEMLFPSASPRSELLCSSPGRIQGRNLTTPTGVRHVGYRTPTNSAQVNERHREASTALSEPESPGQWRSKANTASRMAPPAPSSSGRAGNGHKHPSELVQSHRNMPQKEKNTAATEDNGRCSSSGSKPGRRFSTPKAGEASPSSNERPGSHSVASVTPGQKRKGHHAEADRGASKRPRGSPTSPESHFSVPSSTHPASTRRNNSRYALRFNQELAQ